MRALWNCLLLVLEGMSRFLRVPHVHQTVDSWLSVDPYEGLLFREKDVINLVMNRVVVLFLRVLGSASSGGVILGVFNLFDGPTLRHLPLVKLDSHGSE